MTQSTEFTPESETSTLAYHVSKTVENYIDQLEGDDPVDLYGLVLEVVEPQIFAAVMRHCRNNQSEAARILGISRGTLRTKLKRYFDDTYVSSRDE